MCLHHRPSDHTLGTIIHLHKSADCNAHKKLPPLPGPARHSVRFFCFCFLYKALLDSLWHSSDFSSKWDFLNLPYIFLLVKFPGKSPQDEAPAISPGTCTCQKILHRNRIQTRLTQILRIRYDRGTGKAVAVCKLIHSTPRYIFHLINLFGAPSAEPEWAFISLSLSLLSRRHPNNATLRGWEIKGRDVHYWLCIRFVYKRQGVLIIRCRHWEKCAAMQEMYSLLKAGCWARDVPGVNWCTAGCLPASFPVVWPSHRGSSARLSSHPLLLLVQVSG